MKKWNQNYQKTHDSYKTNYMLKFIEVYSLMKKSYDLILVICYAFEKILLKQRIVRVDSPKEWLVGLKEKYFSYPYVQYLCLEHHCINVC